MSTLTPNRLNSILSVFEEKGLQLPKTIEKSEAGKMHIAILTSTPNLERDDFDHVLKIVKTNVESYPVLERELAKEKGKIFILHDGNEYRNAGGVDSEPIQTTNENSSKELESVKAEAEAAKTQAEESAKELESVKAENEKQSEYLGKLEEDNEVKDSRIKELEAELEKAKKSAKKTEKPAESKE